MIVRAHVPCVCVNVHAHVCSDFACLLSQPQTDAGTDAGDGADAMDVDSSSDSDSSIDSLDAINKDLDMARGQCESDDAKIRATAERCVMQLEEKQRAKEAERATRVEAMEN
jgi:pyruvate/oxaloacetate carboxyltransferase